MSGATAQRAVVVTGASTGIGRVCAEQLQRSGFQVFAGVRSAAHEADLRAAGIAPLRLDVTDEASLALAASAVAQQTGERGLHGLVNNAGVAVVAPLELVPLAELRRQLEVNVVGAVACVQAFAPLLRRARGRVVNVSSIAGRVVSPLFGPYAASKFALEALSDALRRELAPAGIEVSVVQPGVIDTPIWEKSLQVGDQTLERIGPRARELYGKTIDAVRDFAQTAGKKATSPREVAEVIEQALTASVPRTRYLVGTDAKVLAALAGVVTDRVLDRLMALTQHR